MPHIITYTEEIEEHGACQQRPASETGERYLHEVEGRQCLRIVRSVHFDRYVWENIAQWTTEIEEYLADEFILCSLTINPGTELAADVPVFVANGMVGVLSRDKDLVQGEVVIPAKIGEIIVRGVAHSGFMDCPYLTKVTFEPMVVIAYDHAFANCGLRKMVFNDEVPVLVHATAIEGCERLPDFNRLHERPFPGKYLFYDGDLFRNWEEKLYELHFLFRLQLRPTTYH